MSIIKGARNLDEAKKFYDWALTAEAQDLALRGQRLPGACRTSGAAKSDKAPDLLDDQADRLRLQEVRLERRAQAPAVQVGHRRLDPAAVSRIAQRQPRTDRPSGADLLDHRRVGRLCPSALVRGRGFLDLSTGWLDGWPLDADYAPAAVLVAHGAEAVAGADAARAGRAAAGAGAAQVRPGLCPRADRRRGRSALPGWWRRGLASACAALRAGWLEALFGPLGRPAVRHGLRRAAHRLGLPVPLHPRHRGARCGRTAMSSSPARSAG